MQVRQELAHLLEAANNIAAELGAGTCVYLSTGRASWLSGRYVDARWDMEEL